MEDEKRNKQFVILLTADEKRTIQAAAKLSKWSMSQFIRARAIVGAHDVIAADTRRQEDEALAKKALAEGRY